MSYVMPARRACYWQDYPGRLGYKRRVGRRERKPGPQAMARKRPYAPAAEQEVILVE